MSLYKERVAFGIWTVLNTIGTGVFVMWSNTAKASVKETQVCLLYLTDLSKPFSGACEQVFNFGLVMIGFIVFSIICQAHVIRQELLPGRNHTIILSLISFFIFVFSSYTVGLAQFGLNITCSAATLTTKSCADAFSAGFALFGNSSPVTRNYLMFQVMLAFGALSCLMWLTSSIYLFRRIRYQRVANKSIVDIRGEAKKQGKGPLPVAGNNYVPNILDPGMEVTRQEPVMQQAKMNYIEPEVHILMGQSDQPVTGYSPHYYAQSNYRSSNQFAYGYNQQRVLY